MPNKALSRFAKRPDYFMPKSEEIIVKKDFVYDDNHKLRIKEVEKVNIQEYINAQAEECGLKAILSRILKDDDAVAFNNLALKEDQLADIRVMQSIDVNSINQDPTDIETKVSPVLSKLGLTKEKILQMSDTELNEFISAKANEILKSQESEK